ncbi:uncharacterized protein UTRI_00113_B [Ustilago trichophora]|uniref:HECT-type E3 ubiquitin transferase n=1 Tax=Ustilago trichophora TaxID=86804 RepID=A0A5C3DP21_9BASI|nr:uncharacterized protein UTRI_00113_B [Ustilago trichophora]
MEANKEASRPVWAAKKSWTTPSSTSTSSSSTASSSRDPTPSASSAFPPLSSPQARRPSSRSNSTSSYPSPSPSSSLISQTSFNPYPTRRQELAQRAATHSTRKRSHITRSDPSTSRIHSIFDYDHDDDALMHDVSDDNDEGEVSSRGATMSSIVFRDLSASTSTSRSASPWQQQGGMSAGLAMFATTTFGGEPLRVLANVDEELGAAHMGPRIYKRHNQKHVRNRVRAKIDATHIASSTVSPKQEKKDDVDGRTLGAITAELTLEEKERLRNVDLQKLVDECRRYHNLSAVQSRIASSDMMDSSMDSTPTTALLAAIRIRITDLRPWSSMNLERVISDDLLPVDLQQPPIDFSVLPAPLLAQVRQSVVQALTELVHTDVEMTRSDLVSTLASLLSLRPLRPTSVVDPDLKPAVQTTFLHLLDTFNRLLNPSELLSSVLTHHDQHTDDSLLTDLVGELVGLCGQQMSSNPTILTETQDRTLVTVSSFLSLCFAHNATRPAASRLPVHAFYCTVLDLAPFLEHFVHFAATFARPSATPALGMAEFNICRSPFLLSLGAKVRILQLENEVRLAKVSSRETFSPQRFGVEGSNDAELVVLPTSLNLKIERENAWEQSKALFLQWLESGAPVRGLRVEFVGEQAADGGGPAREWFATVASTWFDPRSVITSHGWFQGSNSDEKKAEETAAFLGLLLACAALHTTKLALPFTLPSAAFKIATCPNLDTIALTPVDLEFADTALARSLQAVLDWSPPLPRGQEGEEDVEKQFDSTFSLTWSTSIASGEAGEVKTIDLVPGGRHRSVKFVERNEFVSKLVWRVLVGSVRGQVSAFRDAWQSVFPSGWLHTGEERKGPESATEILSRGGLAISLFSLDEVGQAILSLPSSDSTTLSAPLDIADIKGATETVIPTSHTAWDGAVVSWFWDLWSNLSALHQRRLLAFITGAEDLPATGARGIGLRIHLVPTDLENDDARSWPLPWSSTCTTTLFLPTYPNEALLEQKVRIAIEHYQGFGLR